MALRAAASLIMLAGFFAVAVVQFAGAVALAVRLATVGPSIIAVKLTWLLVAVPSWAIGRATWNAIRTRPDLPTGLLVTPDQAPLLWQTVRDLANEVGTRPPDEIWLTPDVNASVFESSRLLGLIGGERRLHVGLPLLHTMTVSQVRAVLAHELGHYSREHTRLAAPAYRGRLVIASTLDRISPYNPVGWIFKGYGRLYVLADNTVARRQELEADLAAARVAGRDAAASALREVHVLDAAWDFFWFSYVRPGWESGFAPDDVFAGFGELMAARTDELDELRSSAPEESGSKWDAHPPLAKRISVILAAPQTPVTPDERPGRVLLRDFAESGRRLQREAMDGGDRTVLAWPEFTAAALDAGLQREADATFRTIARVAGHAEIGLADVFDLIAAGRLIEIGQPLFPDATRREVGSLFAEPLESLLQLAASRSGVARWRHSWSGPAEFLDRNGVPPPLDEIAKLAVSSGGLDKALAELDQLGIEIGSASVAERAPTTFGSMVLGGLANVKVDDIEYDLVVLTTGLVLVPDPGKTDKGRRRLAELIESTSAAKPAEWHRFVAYEQIASATVSKRLPVVAELTLHGGQTLRVREKLLSEELGESSRDALLAVLDGLI